jgi:tRNA dimethylallyltransferase
VLRQEMNIEQARAAIQQATRRYAKRQITWFRKEAGVRWFEGFGDEPAVQQGALAHIREEIGPASRPAPGSGV